MNAQANLPGIDRANHSNQGAWWEKQLEAAHDWYRLQGWADVRKVPHNWAFISEKEYVNLQRKLPASHLAKTDDSRFMQRVKSDVDFIGGGFYRNKFFSVVFDAKSSGGNLFPLSNIEPHQLEKLRSRARCGFDSGIMLYMSEYGRAFFIPFKYLDAKYLSYQKSKIGRRAARGSASLSINDLEMNAREIRPNPRNGVWDWLAVIFP